MTKKLGFSADTPIQYTSFHPSANSTHSRTLPDIPSLGSSIVQHATYEMDEWRKLAESGESTDTKGGFEDASHTQAISLAFIGGCFAIIVAFCLNCSLRDTSRAPNGIGERITAGGTAFRSSISKFISFVGLGIYSILLVLYTIENPSNDKTDGIRIGVSFILGVFAPVFVSFCSPFNTASNANMLVAQAAQHDGVAKALGFALSAGSFISFLSTGVGSFVLCIMYAVMAIGRGSEDMNDQIAYATKGLVGFALGSSITSIMGRLSTGLFSETANLGESIITQETHRKTNPVTLSSKAGLSLAKIAGASADYYETFILAIVAAASLSGGNMPLFAFPFWVAGTGMITSIVGFFLVRVKDGADKNDILFELYKGKTIAGILLITFSFIIASFIFDSFSTGWKVSVCVIVGQVFGMAMAFSTEFFTSKMGSSSVAKRSVLGSGTVVLQGLGIGMISTIISAVILVFATLACLALSGFYGIAIAGVAMVSTTGINLAIDVIVPMTSNAVTLDALAGGEGAEALKKLDEAAVSAAAGGKGSSVGAAAFVCVSVLGAFVTEAKVASLNLFNSTVLAGILVGVTIPFVYSGLVLLSVQKNAVPIVNEAMRLLEDVDLSEADSCFEILAKISIQDTILPSFYAIIVPIVVAVFVGPECLGAMIIGTTAIAFLLTITMTNAGTLLSGANHSVGSTVGAPLKGACGTSLMPLAKTMAMVSLTIAPFLQTLGEWGYWYYGLIPVVIFVIVTGFVVVKYWMGAEELSPGRGPGAQSKSGGIQA